MIGDFAKFLIEEATQNYHISFRDGDPRETFFDSFNSQFDTDQGFCDLLNLIVHNIEQISPEDKRRMSEIQIYIKAKHYDNQGKGFAFFKIVNFYKAGKEYEQIFQRSLLDEVGMYKNGTVCETIVRFILKARQYFHQGLNFDF